VKGGRAIRLCAAFALLLPALSLRAETFVVTNTADTGSGSLRQAILDANGTPGSTIAFSIGSGVQTIQPLSELPELSSGTIDGTTQPGYLPGYPHAPLIEIDGSLLPALSYGLKLGNGSSTAAIKALVVNRFPRMGIWANGPVVVTGCWIGVDPNGVVAQPNGIGIQVVNSGATIGGTGFGEGNLISGNIAAGVLMSGPGTVVGNGIGTVIGGTSALPNLNDGVSIENTSNVTIETNMISGNIQFGVAISSSTNVVIRNNNIGPYSIGVSGYPQRAGVWLHQSAGVLIGGAKGEANDIANNDVGVAVESSSTGVRITNNFIHSNGFGIDLDYSLNPLGSRVTPNDPGDGDTGGNDLQNFPVLEFVHSTFSSTTIRGSLQSKPNSGFHLEFFSSETCNASGYGEGKFFLGSIEIGTNSAGMGTFEPMLSQSTPLGNPVTATARDALGNTSEFSACVPVTEPVGQQFFTLVLCRVVDTRNANGPLNGPALAGYSGRKFALAGACGIPASAKSVAVNLTVTQPVEQGHLTIHPADLGIPLASSINFSAGQTRSNNAVLKLSIDESGSVTVENVSAGPVHFILDVSGYFE
jgi:parallel beta-helix repeat protein